MIPGAAGLPDSTYGLISAPAGGSEVAQPHSLDLSVIRPPAGKLCAVRPSEERRRGAADPGSNAPDSRTLRVEQRKSF